jgi:hypothetical protein
MFIFFKKKKKKKKKKNRQKNISNAKNYDADVIDNNAEKNSENLLGLQQFENNIDVNSNIDYRLMKSIKKKQNSNSIKNSNYQLPSIVSNKSNNDFNNNKKNSNMEFNEAHVLLLEKMKNDEKNLLLKNFYASNQFHNTNIIYDTNNNNNDNNNNHNLKKNRLDSSKSAGFYSNIIKIYKIYLQFIDIIEIFIRKFACFKQLQFKCRKRVF